MTAGKKILLITGLGALSAGALFFILKRINDGKPIDQLTTQELYDRYTSEQLAAMYHAAAVADPELAQRISAANSQHLTESLMTALATNQDQLWQQAAEQRRTSTLQVNPNIQNLISKI